jgi:acetyltransferase-like isoleucine patch superfamily enzyme
VQDLRPLPPKLDNEEEDAAQFDTTDPYVIAPIKVDYGTQVKVAPGTFVNAGATFIDTCDIVIGPRVLLAPNVSFFSGTHPLDPAVRDGLSGPEMGGKIVIEEDCWIGGSAIILPGITVGRGSTVGAGSVVTKVYCAGRMTNV